MKKSLIFLVLVSALLAGAYFYIWPSFGTPSELPASSSEAAVVPEDPTLLYTDPERGFSVVLTKPWMGYAVETGDVVDGSTLVSFLAPTKLQPAGLSSLFTIAIFSKAEWEKQTAPCAADPSVSQICGQVSHKLGENETSVFAYSLINGFPEEDQKDALEDVEKKILKSFKVLEKSAPEEEEEAVGGIEAEENAVVE